MAWYSRNQKDTMILGDPKPVSLVPLQSNPGYRVASQTRPCEGHSIGRCVFSPERRMGSLPWVSSLSTPFLGPVKENQEKPTGFPHLVALSSALAANAMEYETPRRGFELPLIYLCKYSVCISRLPF